MRRMLLFVALILVFPSFLSNVEAAQPAPEPALDLIAIVLTTTDLQDEGFEEYRLENSSEFDAAATAAFVSKLQRLDPYIVADKFEAAGQQGSYFTMFNLRADPDDRTSQLQRGIETGVYLFADEAGAKAGFKTIANENVISNATDFDDVGRGLGDESEMTIFTIHRSPNYGVPTTQLELEILVGRLVIEVSTFNYEPETAGTATYEPDEPANLEALGQRLIDRADAVLSGNSPDLTALLLPIASPETIPPYRAYTLLDGEPIQDSFESDQNLQDRLSGQQERGTESVLFSEQLVRAGDDALNEIRFYNGIFQYASTDKARAYIEGIFDRLSDDPAFLSVENAGEPALGDEALMLTFEVEVDGGSAKFNQLYIRNGAIVATIYIQEFPLTLRGPFVSVDALEELGAAQADCLDAGGCDSTVALPDELVLAIAALDGHPQLPEEDAIGTPTVEELLARVETFDNLSRQHTDGPVEYDQNPPVGGMHNPVLQNCGFYSEPVGNEHAVHSLEHGTVWITYDPDLPAADIAKLEAMVEGHDYLLISPYEGLPSPVVASAWGVQLQLDGVDDPYLIAFIDYFEQGPQTPEIGGLCSEGTSETVG
jgi:hypothetical protein